MIKSLISYTNGALTHIDSPPQNHVLSSFHPLAFMTATNFPWAETGIISFFLEVSDYIEYGVQIVVLATGRKTTNALVCSSRKPG